MSDYIKRGEAFYAVSEEAGMLKKVVFDRIMKRLESIPSADVMPKGAIAESLNILYDELDTDDEKYYVRGYQDALEDVYEDLVSDTVPRDEVEVTAHKDRIGKLVEIATGARMDGEKNE